MEIFDILLNDVESFVGTTKEHWTPLKLCTPSIVPTHHYLKIPDSMQSGPFQLIIIGLTTFLTSYVIRNAGMP